jgi:hypothetical protein
MASFPHAQLINPFKCKRERLSRRILPNPRGSKRLDLTGVRDRLAMVCGRFEAYPAPNLVTTISAIPSIQT